MIILTAKNNSPVMQGKTTLENNQTILYNGKKTLTNHCRCGKPFAESISELGIILETVMCAACGKEQAHIVTIEETA